MPFDDTQQWPISSWDEGPDHRNQQYRNSLSQHSTISGKYQQNKDPKGELKDAKEQKDSKGEYTAPYLRRKVPVESQTLAGGVKVPISRASNAQRYHVSPELEAQLPQVHQVQKIMEQPSLHGWGAIIVETRADAALRLSPGALLPFVGGISSTDNREAITISRDGTSFSVTRQGLYRLVLELEIIEGSPSMLKFESPCLPPECQRISQLKFKREGEYHRSTILSLRPGSELVLVNRSETPITLAPEARLQIYRVG